MFKIHIIGMAKNFGHTVYMLYQMAEFNLWLFNWITEKVEESFLQY